ncbi:hypothetical protein ACIBG8_11115 [Nonomuraea sp. NPDC050556]|uniref:hypothetical protein n=1 Tax=Nonomuraea sp. NPDC050556 TaxID=3364369 RepID=UPI00379B4371
MRLVLFVMMLAAALAGAAPAQAATAEERVALIGVPGLMWSDVDQAATPNLWRLAGESGLGSVSVKTVGTTACPYDAWLTVSSGVRSAMGQRCGLAPPPVKSGEGATVAEFATLHGQRDGKYAGTLGTALHGAGKCTAAVGAGAAMALADTYGKVDLYADTIEQLGDWSRCQVLAADIDTLVKPYLDARGKVAQVPEQISAAQRAALVKQVDAQVGEVLGHLPGGTQVLLAGLGDHGSMPHLRTLMWKSAGAQGTYLGSTSTRRADIVILPDLTPMILNAVGVRPPDTVVGVQFRQGEHDGVDAAAAHLRRSDLTGTTVRSTTGYFFTGFAICQVAFYGITFFLLSRRRRLGGIGVAALAVASIPVSTYLVNLLPWVRFGSPTVALVGGVLVIAAAILALATLGPWRRHPLGPPAVVAGITGATLLADLLTGTTLQFNSLMGYTAVVGGRYYGLANIPFALLATAVLMVTAIVADHLVRVGRRTAAVWLVAGLGLVAMLLAGFPGIGSDFGGVIAFVPGIAVTALLVAGKRVSVVKLLLFCVAGGVTVSVIAVLDHLRPVTSQTHLGRFVGQVLDGTFMPMIGRKLGAMLSTMLSPNLMPIVIAGIVFLVYAVLRPGKASVGALPEAFAKAPMLKAGLIGALVSGVVGMLVNDSGTAVLSMAVSLAAPLVLYAGVRGLAEHTETENPAEPPLEPATVPA